jgi:hypothetical protein
MRRKNKRDRWAGNTIVTAAAVVLLSGCASQPLSSHRGDPHYTEAGFFDLHVCHWPEQPLFFMALFSTPRYADVGRIEVLRPDGAPLGELDLARYRMLRKAGQPEKRVFIHHLPVPPDAPEGWYNARILLKDGTQYSARDYVRITAMPQANGFDPPSGAEGIVVPTQLRWSPIAGARHYQVYIRDAWDEGQLLYTSPLLNSPQLQLPPGLLKPGGLYRWRVHARDVNEHPEVGDFNHGSLSVEASFSTQ